MRALLDTNIALRRADVASPQCGVATAAVAELRARTWVLCLVPQSIYEYWSASTRPVSANGRGCSPSEVALEVSQLRGEFSLLGDPPDLFDRWLALVIAHNVSGKPTHDARLVAAMEAHAIKHILTFNTIDFARYPGVVALDPAAVAAGAVP